MTAKRLGYIPALDGLRTIGIALVLITHGAKPAYLPGGFGVDIFFVLSGFLITTLLLVEWDTTGRIAFGAFYARRLIRLYPALLVAVAATVVLGVFLVPDLRKFFLESAAALLYLTPVTEYTIGPSTFYGHLWTLAYEEYFYLVWPVVLVFFFRLKLSWKTQASLMIGGGLALLLVRVATSFMIDFDAPMLRAGCLAIGCGVAIVVAHTAARGHARVLAGVGIVALVAAWLSSGNLAHSVNPIFAAVAAVALIYSILASGSSITQRILESKPFVYTGKISYELYLWHVPVLLGGALIVGLERNEIWWWAYPITYVIAAATHEAFKPLQKRLRARVAKSRRTVVISPAS